MGVVLNDSGPPAERHSYALVEGAEHAVEVSSAFVLAGLRASERVTLIGLDDRQTDALLVRLREDGAQPSDALAGGQLVLLDASRTRAVYATAPRQVGDQLIELTATAVRDGYTGIRFGGLRPGIMLSPHEETLNAVIGGHPVTALCLYDVHAPADVISAADRLHQRRLPSGTLHDDGGVRITTISSHALRVAGRITAANRDPVMSVLSEAARGGRRTVDAASLRAIDAQSLSALLTSGLGLHLRRPHPAVRHMARQLAGQSASRPHIAATRDRTGTPVPGQTAPEIVATLIWRTFGDARPARATSVLDWAGLFAERARSVTEVAAAHHTTRPTLLNRVRQVRTRGAQTPLSPLVLRDAMRATQSTEDHLSRQRIAELLDVPEPGLQM